MKPGDLVRLINPSHYGCEIGDYHIVEEIIDYGVNGRGMRCTLVGWPHPSNRQVSFHKSSLQVVHEAR